MFRCIDGQSQQDVIILDAEWSGENLHELRSKGQVKSLLCPQCKLPVIVKAGDEKIWHFAHKTLGSCPLQTEPADVLRARRHLYKWLRTKFIGQKERSLFDQDKEPIVTVEKAMDHNLPRPVDCYVELPDGKKIAYWIVEKGMKGRTGFHDCFRDISLNVLFLSDMMRIVPEEDMKGQKGPFVDLTPTERYFLTESKYDIPYKVASYSVAYGKSLHYVNPVKAEVISLRGVCVKHEPNRYSVAAMLVHPISEMLTNVNGEFIHLGEHEKMTAYDKVIKERIRKEPYWSPPQEWLDRSKFVMPPMRLSP